MKKGLFAQILKGDDKTLPCLSEAKRRISQVIATTEFEIPHFVANDIAAFILRTMRNFKKSDVLHC